MVFNSHEQSLAGTQALAARQGNCNGLNRVTKFQNAPGAAEQLGVTHRANLIRS